MPQKQGSRISDGGRLDGSNGSEVAAADFALGVGWGDGAVVKTVSDGSTDQRGTIEITSVGANQAQATATVTLTFKDGAYASTPHAIVQLVDNDNAVTTAQPTKVTITDTTLEWTAAVLPVATKKYKFTYIVVA
jgi:hypothetical protein